MTKPLIYFAVQEPFTYTIAAMLVLVQIYVWVKNVAIGTQFYAVSMPLAHSLAERFAYHYQRIREGEIWRIITSPLFHGGIAHIGLNITSLVSLNAEHRFGPSTYLAYTATLLIACGALMYAST